MAGDHLGQGGLARAGRSPQDHRAQAVSLDQHPQRLPRTEEVVLADDVIERDRPESIRQRGAPGKVILDRRCEQIVAHDQLGRTSSAASLGSLAARSRSSLASTHTRIVGVDDPKSQPGELAGQVVETGLDLGTATAVLGGLASVTVSLAGLHEQDQRSGVGGLRREHQVEQDELPGIEAPALGPNEFQAIQTFPPRSGSPGTAVPSVWAIRSLKRPKPSGS